MSAAAHGDHPRTVCGRQPIEQQTGERKMTEVVGAHLHFEPVSSPPIRNRHHARVVTQDMKTVVTFSKRVGECPHRARLARSSSIASTAAPGCADFMCATAALALSMLRQANI